jgi:WD40 repeat protein
MPDATFGERVNQVGGLPPLPIAVSAGMSFMSKIWRMVGLVALVLTVFVSSSNGQEATFTLPGMGGYAVSPDNSTLVVSVTSKAELVYYDTLASKETKRVTVDFQPTQMVWSDKVLFVARKSSGVVHIVDANSGKELATGNASGPVRNLTVAKGICYASTSNREVYSIDSKGKSTKTAA